MSDVGLSVEAKADMLLALLARIDSAAPAPAYLSLFDGDRPAVGSAPAGDLVCVCPLASPAGAVDESGYLVVAAGATGTIVKASAPTFAQLRTGSGDFVLDGACRLSGAPDAGQTFVIAATALQVGGLMAVVGGSIGPS